MPKRESKEKMSIATMRRILDSSVAVSGIGSGFAVGFVKSVNLVPAASAASPVNAIVPSSSTQYNPKTWTTIWLT